MHTQEPRSSKPGEYIIPPSWQRMLVLILSVAIVSLILIACLATISSGVENPKPDPSPPCASAQC